MRADIRHRDIKGGDAELILLPQNEKGNLEIPEEAEYIAEMVSIIEQYVQLLHSSVLDKKKKKRNGKKKRKEEKLGRKARK